MIEMKLVEEAETDQIEKLVVGAAILCENKCLCVQRAEGDFMGGLVELPSGGVDKNESLQVALLREVQEETGIVSPSSQELTYLDSFDYTSGSGKKARQFNFVVNLETQPEVILNPEEHSQYFWLSEQDLNNSAHNISEKTKKIIKSSFDSEGK